MLILDFIIPIFLMCFLNSGEECAEEKSDRVVGRGAELRSWKTNGNNFLPKSFVSCRYCSHSQPDVTLKSEARESSVKFLTFSEHTERNAFLHPSAWIKREITSYCQAWDTHLKYWQLQLWASLHAQMRKSIQPCVYTPPVSSF